MPTQPNGYSGDILRLHSLSGAYSADLASKVRRPSAPVSHPPTVAKMIRHAHGEAWMRRAKAFRGIKMLLLMSCGGIFEHPDSVEDMKGMITG